MTALHQFRGSLTAGEADSIALFSAREIKATAAVAVPMIVGFAATIMGLIQLGFGNMSAALTWLVLAGIAVFALGLQGVIARRRERKTKMQEIRGSIGPDGLSVIDRGLPILHEWSVLRGVDSGGELLTVWLSDDRTVILSPRMFDSRLEYESAASMVKRNVRSFDST